MNEFEISLYTILLGISSASGIIYEGDRSVFISDDSYVMYLYSHESDQVDKINIHSGNDLKEQMAKPLKPDFEAIGRDGEFYFVFGSGSAENRFDLVEIHSGTLDVTGRYSLEALYGEMMETTGISHVDLNIEGVVFQEHKIYMFNRGNGPGNINGVFKIDQWRDRERRKIDFKAVPLPEIDGVPLTFTDACLLDESIYFVASAEDTTSTYYDGEVLGSAIGEISLDGLELVGTRVITDKYKIEGISFYGRNVGKTSFLLCEDADDGVPESKVFRLDLYD